MALEDQLLDWFSRPTPDRGIQHLSEFDAVVGTDRGLKREENQDRAVIMRCPADAYESGYGIVFAVADGMGGMRDGAKCASLTLASFLATYIQHRDVPLLSRLHVAMSAANKAVFAYANGNGGSTLSVVVLDSEGAASANLGDSRIYAFGPKVERLTVDDSMAELMGSPGHELLQFIGMGDGMRPRIDLIRSMGSRFVITSDGIHYINADTLEAVLCHTSSLKTLAERLQALARWCGSPDNATLIAAEAHVAARAPRLWNTALVELWDGFAKLYLSLGSDSKPAHQAATSAPAPPTKPKQKLTKLPSASSRRKIRAPVKKKQPQRGTPPIRDDDRQLEIKIGPAEESANDFDR